MAQPFNPQQYYPKRVGVSYEPPALVIEYFLLSNQARSLFHKIPLYDISSKDTQTLIKTIRKEHGVYFSKNKITEANIYKLIEKIRHKSTRNRQSTNAYNSSHRESYSFNNEPKAPDSPPPSTRPHKQLESTPPSPKLQKEFSFNEQKFPKPNLSPPVSQPQQPKPSKAPPTKQQPSEKDDYDEYGDDQFESFDESGASNKKKEMDEFAESYRSAKTNNNSKDKDKKQQPKEEGGFVFDLEAEEEGEKSDAANDSLPSIKFGESSSSFKDDKKGKKETKKEFKKKSGFEFDFL